MTVKQISRTTRIKLSLIISRKIKKKESNNSIDQACIKLKNKKAKNIRLLKKKNNCKKHLKITPQKNIKILKYL
jgi:hypothetical protein